MKRVLMVGIVLLLMMGVVVAIPRPSWPPPSPLTALGFGGDDLNHTQMDLALPWYGIQAWEVEVCTRGLTSLVGADSSSNDIIESSLSTPIYMDTVTILAKRSQVSTNPADGYYYELGWYVQPFSGSMGANVTVRNSAGREWLVKEGTASEASAFDGYEAFQVPCDQRVTRQCKPFSGELVSARLSWWTTNGTENGPVQYFVTRFIEVNETNG